MDEFKSPVSRLAKLFKKSRDTWKAKALEKQRRLRAAQVKVRDLEQSREQWKKRALEAEKALTGAGEGPVRGRRQRPINRRRTRNNATRGVHRPVITTA